MTESLDDQKAKLAAKLIELKEERDRLLKERDRLLAPLTLQQAAARLGVSRSSTLVPAINLGNIATVLWGKRKGVRRVPIAEMRRLEREGFSSTEKNGAL
jgi:hypothetical protein